MLQMGNQARAPSRCPELTAAPRRGPSPLQAVPGAIGGCGAVTVRRTTTELQTRHPDFLTRPRARDGSAGCWRRARRRLMVMIMAR